MSKLRKIKDYFFECCASNVCKDFPLTRGDPEGSLLFYEELLPDDVLSLRVLRYVSHDTHLWPEEFPDLA
jgi:hypothetical protein